MSSSAEQQNQHDAVNLHSQTVPSDEGQHHVDRESLTSNEGEKLEQYVMFLPPAEGTPAAAALAGT